MCKCEMLVKVEVGGGVRARYAVFIEFWGKINIALGQLELAKMKFEFFSWVHPWWSGLEIEEGI